MSAPYCIVFFGIKFVTKDEDVVSDWERNRHAYVREYKQEGLDWFWTSSGYTGENTLFIGKKLGIMGIEQSLEEKILSTELFETVRYVEDKIKSFSFKEVPALHMQWDENE